jgi:hypothetical protein
VPIRRYGEGEVITAFLKHQAFMNEFIERFCYLFIVVGETLQYLVMAAGLCAVQV